MPRTKTTRDPLGSIFQRKVKKNGKLVKVFDVRKRFAELDEDGNKVWKSKSQRCYSYSEAITALSNMPVKIADHKKKTSGERAAKHTLGQLTDYYRTQYLKPAVFVGDRQVEGYRQDLRNIERAVQDIEDFFSRSAWLHQISYEDVRRFSVHLATTPIKRKGTPKLPEIATINRKLAYFRRILNVGKQLRWIITNPFTEGRSLIHAKSERPRTRVLSFEEESRLLAACEDPDVERIVWRGRTVEYQRPNQRSHLKLIILLAIDAGLRRKEIFSLQRFEIKLDAGIIDLTGRKTKALRQRTVVISPRLERELRQYFSKITFHPQGYLFFGQKDADRAFATACRRAGIKGITFHGLRHTAVTWLDEAGISNANRREMIGHASDKVHADYHTISPDIVRSVRDKMAAFEKRKNQQ
jgi:integrase